MACRDAVSPTHQASEATLMIIRVAMAEHRTPVVAAFTPQRESRAGPLYPGGGRLSVAAASGGCRHTHEGNALVSLQPANRDLARANKL